jgi:hypothetical protein
MSIILTDSGLDIDKIDAYPVILCKRLSIRELVTRILLYLLSYVIILSKLPRKQASLKQFSDNAKE